MNCLGENLIQMYIDGETDEPTRQKIEGHLSHCSGCRAQYEAMLEDNAFCLDVFSDYGAALDQEMLQVEEKPFTAAPVQLESYRNQKIKKQTVKPNEGVKNKMKKYQKYIASVAVVGLIVTGMSIEPVRASVSDVVSIFRAEQMKTMDISLASLQEVERALSEKDGKINIENLAQINQVGGDSKNFTSLEAAEAEMGFGVTPLTGLDGRYQLNDISGITKQSIDFTLEIDAVNELMKTLGAEKLFDTSLDGKTFSVHMSPSVSVGYEDSANHKYVNYSMTKMPQVVAPAGTDINELVSCIASLGILPREIQNQLKNMTDMGETLYIPNVNGTVKTFEMNGKKVFGSFSENESYQYGYITWLENGIIHVISGDINQADAEALLSGK